VLVGIMLVGIAPVGIGTCTQAQLRPRYNALTVRSPYVLAWWRLV